jgi:hypothetical protein
MDFMLYDAQKLLLKRHFTPTNRRVKPLDVDLHILDPARVLDEGEKWQKVYRDIITAHG